MKVSATYLKILISFTSLDAIIEAKLVCGKCIVKYIEDIEDLDFYFTQNAHHFYFAEVHK